MTNCEIKRERLEGVSSKTGKPYSFDVYTLNINGTLVSIQPTLKDKSLLAYLLPYEK